MFMLWVLGAAKDPPIVTPLMDYVRQKRAAKSGGRVHILISFSCNWLLFLVKCMLQGTLLL